MDNMETLPLEIETQHFEMEQCEVDLEQDLVFDLEVLGEFFQPLLSKVEGESAQAKVEVKEGKTVETLPVQNMEVEEDNKFDPSASAVACLGSVALKLHVHEVFDMCMHGMRPACFCLM